MIRTRRVINEHQKVLRHTVKAENVQQTVHLLMPKAKAQQQTAVHLIQREKTLMLSRIFLMRKAREQRRYAKINTFKADLTQEVWSMLTLSATAKVTLNVPMRTLLIGTETAGLPEQLKVRLLF